MQKKREDLQSDVWCVIPVYNNSATIKDVALGCLNHLDKVLIVDDGSTDTDVAALMKSTGITVLTHSENRGKGAAILTALTYVTSHNASHIICIDGDGQHSPDDIPAFIDKIQDHENSIIIGCRDFSSETVPGSSKFGRGFSNMWIKIETGITLKDTQSGFRAYPIEYLNKLKLHGTQYDFEIEVLTRAAWAGLTIEEIDIHVRYQEDRVSSFKPFKSNLQISLMHTRLIGRRLIPWPHKKLLRHKTKSLRQQLLNPKKFIGTLLKENASPAGLAASAAIGTLIAVLPIMGFHTITIIYVTARLHLNKVMALAIQNLYAPPFVPFVCIQVGYYMRHGAWWTDFKWQAITSNIHHRLFEWLLGSLVLAPFYAAIAWWAVYWIAKAAAKRNAGNKSPDEEKTKAKKRGNTVSLWFFKASLRIFGLRGAYGLLYPVCFYYLLFDREAVKSAMAYIKRRFPDSGWIKRHHYVMMLFVSQGKQLIDRAAALSGQVKFDINTIGKQNAADLAKNAENGMILLTSHMGNWQLAISSLTNFNKDVYLVMLPEHNEALKNALKMRTDNNHIKVISPEGHLGGVVEIMNVLRKGNIVSIMGDRSYGFESINVDFLGDQAAFPYGPFKIAAAAKCPILFLLSEKTSRNTYTVDISKSIMPVHKDSRNKRKELEGWVQDYADILSEYAKKNPMQCFLFHDVWEKKNIESETTEC